ncbi:MAG: hypothetical protein JWP75_1398, partial [Frondihabitans sp.]|nr:hypothetical protein [Frondihabitans sp.]
RMSSVAAPVRRRDLRSQDSASLDRGSFWSRFLISLPDRIPLVFLGLVLAASLGTTFQIFYAWLVLPGALVFMVVLQFFNARERIAVSRASAIGAGAALVIAVVWFAGNAPFASEWFDATRDPGIYLLEGLWLQHAPSTWVNINFSKDVLGTMPGFSYRLGLFGPNAPGFVVLQGGDVLPGVIAIFGWLGGFKASLEANLVVGLGGLVAVYGLARRIVGPLWALVPELALGISISYIYLARGTYSEIIMLLVAASGLTWLVSAVRSLSKHDFVIAGIFIGVASTARIDGVIAGIGALAVLGVAGLGFIPREKRRPIFIGSLLFVVFCALTTYSGVEALRLHKYAYVTSLQSQIHDLILGSFAVVILFFVCWTVGLVLTPARMKTIWRRVAIPLGGVIVAVLLFWLSRPLWYVGHFQNPGAASTIMGLQRLGGLPQDPTRSYEEQTMAWIGWYYGWPMIGLAIIGFGLLVWRGVRKKDLASLIVALAPLAAAAVYFTRVSITPDQIWAYRRILPVITPGFLIASCVPMALAWQYAAKRWVKILAVVAAAVVAFSPIVTWNGLLLVRNEGNQYTEVSLICKEIGNAKMALLIRDSAPINYALTIRTSCNVPVISVFSPDMTQKGLEQIHAKVGDIPVIAYNPMALPTPARNEKPALTITVPMWNRFINKLPNGIDSSTRRVYFGTLKANGVVVPR